MARDPETIQREIEQARDALAATVDELSVKANPKDFVDRGADAVRARFADPRLRYALIGAGVLVGLLVVRRLFR
ncbi:MAG: DUF3618 domain-containing protein [Kutzneria sp.]|nr:DUF3618 domain-containing protein [Kutzneria sp.]MBV9845632.1 DUF3618 domain-containing protein [Kutzneria sp.]